MSKRGQVYILAAILLAVVLFSLSAIKNKFEQKTIKGDFETLSENFQIEASKLINSVIESPNTDVHEAFKSFSTMFTSYAKGKNPEYGLIYILSYGDKIQVTNFLDRTINVQGCGAGGVVYNISIPGGFEKISASLNFEDFNIRTDQPLVGLEFDCENITLQQLQQGGDISTPENNGRPCAFIYSEAGETELAVVIDDAPYKSCIKKGVPDLMQVGIMKQGEQAKVSATGSCISEDFCKGFADRVSCEQKCGKNVCFWWTISGGGGLCLNKHSYPDRFSGKCPDNGDKYCYEDQIWFYDACGNLISPVSGGNCGSQGKVCRDETNQGGLSTQCCDQKSRKECEGNDVRWYSSCNTKEDLESCGTGEACRDAGGAQCCTIQYQTKCYQNNIYWYSSCDTQEGLATACGENWVCKDQAVGLPEARCCINNYEKKCSENDIYYYDSCGLKGSLVEDCTGGASCKCTDGACECVITMKQQCRCEKYSGGGWTYGELAGVCNAKCGEGATCLKGTVGGGPNDRHCTCYRDYWTDCSGNPSCGSGETKLAEQPC